MCDENKNDEGEVSSSYGFEQNIDRETGEPIFLRGTTGSTVVKTSEGNTVIEQPIDFEEHPKVEETHLQESLRFGKGKIRPKKVKSKLLPDHKKLGFSVKK